MRSRLISRIRNACGVSLVLIAATAPALQNTAQPVIRVCVPPMENTSTRPIGRRLQRDRLVREFRPDKRHKPRVAIEALALNGNRPVEIGREAKDKNCDYILYTELIELRGAGDPEPPIGRGAVVIGNDPLKQYPGRPSINDPVFRAVVDFRLNRRGNPEPLVSTNVTTTEHTSEDDTVSRLLGRIASRVRSELADHN